MGHIRLGDLPRTRQWKQVVTLIDGGAGIAQLANATIAVAENHGMLGKVIMVARGPGNGNCTRRTE